MFSIFYAYLADIRKKTSGDYGKVMLALLSDSRPSDKVAVDEAKATEDAQKLYKAGVVSGKRSASFF